MEDLDVIGRILLVRDDRDPAIAIELIALLLPNRP